MQGLHHLLNLLMTQYRQTGLHHLLVLGLLLPHRTTQHGLVSLRQENSDIAQYLVRLFLIAAGTYQVHMMMKVLFLFVH